MGIMGSFFKFSGHCFDVLAWPLFALVYPLYASIQAIETNSISDTQKLISYWVCFSLILLFENAFSELLECLPWWTYIKVLIVGCLVTPHFEGSLYVYKHIVHPCLSIDLHVLLNELVNLMVVLKQEKVLAEAKNAKATAGEALQNLTALKPEFEESKGVQKDISSVEMTENQKLALTKQPEFEESKGVQKDISSVEMTENQKLALTKQLQFGQLEPDFTPSGNRTTAPLDFTGTTPTWFAARGLPDVLLPSNNVQNEWTCAVCQVTTPSEADLISHLHGRRHESACEKLKAYNQTSKSKVSSASAMENANAAESRGNSPDTKQTHKPWTCATCHVTTTNKADLVSHFQGSRHKDALEKLTAKFQTSENKTHSALAAIAGDVPNIPWTCAVCQVTTTSEADLISHLHGRRHESACEKLKAYNQTSKRKVSSASAMENANAAESRGNSPDTKQTHKPWTCATCHVTTTNKADLVSHFQGLRHEDALEKLKAKFQTSEDKTNSALAAIAGRDVPNIPWTCAVCQLKITNLASLVSHLEGRRHEDACNSYQAKIKSIKSWWCTICNISCSSEGNMKSHLMGSKHLTNARAQQQT
ncbi:zinc finger protein 346 isoform X3 [Manihot esculenta]|uniref:zinc finger protein 346 isoform X3 n=1 Tax=Manihot esculenta TaxID=3983 RepID=UPI001CC4F863|nr:zinc finger protein 346 isoform X3 [Manihot esculenta]